MMKKSMITLGLVGFLAGTSCNKFEDFGDTNLNPNGTTIPNAAALLTNVEAGIAGNAFQLRPGYYAQYFSETQYTEESTYSLPQVDFVGTYTGSLQDLQNIINLNVNNSQTAAAKILKAYILWTITDKWGDIPYSQALTGGLTAPAYDKQEDVYKSLFADLKAAATQFDGSLIGGDIIFGGDQASWIRTANSIRLIMALRLSKRYPDAAGLAATEAKAALASAGGVIDDNSENFKVSYPGSNFQSPYWATYNGRTDDAESKTLTDLMGSLGDARQNAFGGTGDETSSKGVPYGLARQDAVDFTISNPDWAKILKSSVRLENGDVFILTAAHVLLARAEAADRGWTSENAVEMYKAGITASFGQWGIGAPSDTYFTQSTVALTGTSGTGANLSKIALQRYIAFYPDGLQGWSEWRRTGVPTLTPAPAAVNATKQIPRRFTYGQTEYSTNPTAVATAAAALTGGDTEVSRIWWDQ